jgi:hypothetical protein
MNRHGVIVRLLSVCVSTLSLISCAPKEGLIDPAFAAIPIPAAIPPEKKLLTITGLTGSGAAVELDLETIMKFPATSFTLTDPWDGKQHEYTGVALYPLLQRLGLPANAPEIEVTAGNKYKIDVRVRDLAAYGHMLAYRMDGQQTGISSPFLKRGALSIAINFPVHKALDVELYKNQLVWQVVAIAVKKPGG